jgi:hypothetical protein
MALYSVVDAPVNITGITIARNGFTKSQRAALAAAIAHGEVNLSDLTLKQLAKVCGVSVRYAQQARALLAEERASLLSGEVEFADLPPTKTELNRTIARAGTEPTWEALCGQF